MSFRRVRLECNPEVPVAPGEEEDSMQFVPDSIRKDTKEEW